MNHLLHAKLVDQMSRDTLWCMQCALYGKANMADVRYTVERDGFSADILACRPCFTDAVSRPDIVSSEPVTQPAWIALVSESLTSPAR